MNSAIVIRQMQPSDIAFAVQLTLREGWISENRETFEAFFAYDPKGCFVAEKDKKRIGICIATGYQHGGFIGELIVVENERGQGIGRALLDHSIAYLKKKGLKSIYLDGVPEAVPLYERAGFKKICRSLRFTGQIQSESYSNIERMKSEDLPTVKKIDTRAFGENRTFFLQNMLSNNSELVWIMKIKSDMVGYIFARKTKECLSIGPWWNRGDIENPESLLEHLMQNAQNGPLRIGVLESNTKAVQILQSTGLKESSDSSLRMVLGPKGNLGMSNQLYAIGSAAKG
jgi:ribosomal protein S18 acetylase RimI-like enzyme